MFAKKETSVSASARADRRELEHLYARRSAVENLIESLEEYDRVREAARAEGDERQTA
jgi:cell division protein FtsB